MPLEPQPPAAPAPSGAQQIRTNIRRIARRLSPESNPIEIADLPQERDEETLLHAMGSEAANVHLGSESQTKNILKDLRRRKANWLRSAAKDMAKAMEREWKEYANT